VVVTLGSFVAAAAIVALRMSTWAEGEEQRSAETALQRYREALEQGGTEALRAMFDCSAGPQPRVALRLSDEYDVERFRIDSDEATGRVADALREGPLPGHGALKDWRVLGTGVSQGRRLTITVHDDSAPSRWQRMRETVWVIFACGLASAIVGAFVITRRALRPVGDLARTTQGILESGDLALRVPTRGSADDLDQLTELFNRMLARNEVLVRAMTESLANVAHDLRTPLTRLRAGAELALRAPDDSARAAEALAETIEQSDRVLGMLTMLMDIAGAETGVMPLVKQAEDLAGIARDAVELYDIVAADRGVVVTTKLAVDVLVVVDRRRVLQACANLVDNAIKYTPAGGRVEVSVTTDGAWGIVAVADTGAGIDAEDAPRVWDRLFRADRSRVQPGLGLGLSLVKAVVEAHGGEVRLESEVGVGSTFVIRLRRAP
jgi:signal transduction histidine kinase